MKKISEIFSKEELEYISKKRSDLVPMDIPSEKDFTINKPTLDQLIVKFLKTYEVDIEPRQVGQWNGWDTLSTLGLIFSKDGGNNLNIASTIFAANRSSQISSAAQDWGTWKRWVLDKKTEEFEKFKIDVMNSIELHNINALKEFNELSRKATLNNENIRIILRGQEPQKYINNLNNRNQLKTILSRGFVFSIFFIYLILCYSTILEGERKREKERATKSLINNAKIFYRLGYKRFQDTNYSAAIFNFNTVL
tara:strand:+ start:7172 stop:7927 length:756 start_codon:yes stop_codon:yes gene_type:complete